MLKLAVEKRDMKTSADTIRKTNGVPAVFYGPKMKTTPIAVKKGELIKTIRKAGETTIITLDMGTESVDVLVHDVVTHPVSGELIHADFYAVDKDKKVTVAIPLEFVGVAPAVKDLGGTIVKVIHELDVEGLPGSLPHVIEVDINTLTTFDSQVLVKDLVLPNNVSTILEPEEVVVAIAEQKKEEEERVEPADLSSIEVEKKGKQEEPSAE